MNSNYCCMFTIISLYCFVLFCIACCCFAGDVQDGDAWKASKHLDTMWNLGLALNGDGVRLWKSVAYNIFPVFMCILNLPPDIRYNVDNLFLAGLWPGPKEPTERETNMFFKPLIDELRVLSFNGNIFSYCVI